MPELPEVETIAEGLRRSYILHETILHAEVFWPRSLDAAPEEFSKKLQGRQITKISRQGKWLLWNLESLFLLVHLRMTGKFSIHGTPNILPHERIRLIFSNKRILSFIDPRKFGRWHLTKNPMDRLKKLGPDPLTSAFSLEFLTMQLRKKSQTIKAFLLDQCNIAGLGNIYADEVLFASKIHPKRCSHTLSPNEIHLLFLSIKDILNQAVANKGTSLGKGRSNFMNIGDRFGTHQNFLQVYGKQGKPCPRCLAAIEKIVICSRGTHFCANCQQETFA